MGTTKLPLQNSLPRADYFRTWPEPVKTWPSLGIAFAKLGHGGAWRVWTLTRHLDAAGQGWVHRHELRAFLLASDVSLRDAQRWTREARELGLLTLSKDKKCLSYASLEKAARRVALSKVEAPVKVSVSVLLSRKWKASIFAGYLTAHEGKLRSRAFLEAQTGIPARTQRHYGRIAGIQVEKNFLIVKLGDARGINGAGVFNWRNIGNKREPFMLARRMPNIYLSPLLQGRKGRSGKVSQALKSLFVQRLKERLYFTKPSAAQVAKLVEVGKVAYKVQPQLSQTSLSNRWQYIGATA